MSIKQFNGTYSPLEDRLMLRFNTTKNEEYLLWFTRRQTLPLIALIEKITDQLMAPTPGDIRADTPREVAQKITQFQKESVAERACTHKPFEKATDYPLGKEGILVEKCSIKPGVPLNQLNFHLVNHKTIGLNIATNTLYQICLLLKKLVQITGWINIPQTAIVTQPVTSKDKGAKLGSGSRRKKLLH